jgi:hypothetical protein
MRWRQTEPVQDDDRLLAYAVTFTTKHRVDYSVEANYDDMATVEGDIFVPDPPTNPVKSQVELTLGDP